MELERRFANVRFGAKAIEDAFAEYCEVTLSTPVDAIDPSATSLANEAEMHSMSVQRGPSEWTHDDRHEFLSDLRDPSTGAFVEFNMRPEGMTSYARGPIGVQVHVFSSHAVVRVKGAGRPTLVRLMRSFDTAVPANTNPALPPKPMEPPRVFIGHGGSPLWKDLKNHLTDHHSYSVEAYETGSRSGHTIRDVLDTMLNASSFAVLVMTPEDDQADGTVRARQNVVHEAGLFQGRLGFPRVAILAEEGVDLFSNIDGIQYIPFKNIRETYGDVLAALKREFPS